jgi:hypothetical protein
MTSDRAGSTRGLNYYLTYAGRDDETLSDVLFFGLQDGNLLFVRPDTLEQEAVEDRPPIAPETVRMADRWQSEGNESVEVLSRTLDGLLSVETDWSALHASTETDE